MMHVRFSLITADPPVLAGCVGYRQDEARTVVASQHGSLGLALLEEPGVVIFESFWATQARTLPARTRQHGATSTATGCG
jgi:hypothetical protein